MEALMCALVEVVLMSREGDILAFRMVLHKLAKSHKYLEDNKTNPSKLKLKEFIDLRIKKTMP
ncbi:unnamed protein product [Prunus armeniaca]|uniref:Uncharacterized protein n=1 Tax=Prunus armeniaca TaxID=36596 RepID=A0A6J5VP43_PRUAR|nr:unnamed protein product [Prunus armeniaca]